MPGTFDPTWARVPKGPPGGGAPRCRAVPRMAPMAPRPPLAHGRARHGRAAAAYLTMEVALKDELPTFSGGLGVLAGDYLKSAADLGLPVVAVTLAYTNGYFRQQIDEDGAQVELPVTWSPEQLLEATGVTVGLELGGREVAVGAWRYRLEGVGGSEVPIYFLHTDLADNRPEDRAITDQLYRGDGEHRLRQEAVLGLGGVAMLRALGHEDLGTFHMNEGHSALLVAALLDEEAGGPDREAGPRAMAAVRDRCVFTTHTPVAAGHDRFPQALVDRVLAPPVVARLGRLGLLDTGELNMSELGLALSRYANGVSRRHGAVAQQMFPDRPIRSITNGVHLGTWAAPSTVALFDDHLAGWRHDSSMLRYAACIPLGELAEAHGAAKARLLAEVARRTGRALDPGVLTIGLARRATRYKQIGLLFSDLSRLGQIAASAGPVQVVCAGKAHPDDGDGKELLRVLAAASEALGEAVPVVLLENYDLGLAGLLCAGTDLWLNTPVPPNEASGTSGMKAALNGVPSLSVLDGWWIEGCIEGVTGWAIGDDAEAFTAPPGQAAHLSGAAPPPVPEGTGERADALYDKLERVVLPLFGGDPDGYRTVMRNAITLNGSFFSTDRMAREYALNAYRWRGRAPGPEGRGR